MVSEAHQAPLFSPPKFQPTSQEEAGQTWSLLCSVGKLILSPLQTGPGEGRGQGGTSTMEYFTVLPQSLQELSSNS
jgi:hypothetical protein